MRPFVGALFCMLCRYFRMNDTPELNKLLQDNPQIWRASSSTKTSQEGISTGFDALDAILPARGWPANALVEVFVPHWGVGEMQLLLPTLLKVSQRDQWLAWVAPPLVPYAPGLVRKGLALEKMIIFPHEKIQTDVLWVMEKMLHNQSCGIAMSWPEQINDKAMRRLQLAAETGHSLGFVFRDKKAQASPAALRIRLTPTPQGIQVDLLKVRGGNKHRSVYLDLSIS